jgi:hypothetical protein
LVAKVVRFGFLLLLMSKGNGIISGDLSGMGGKL